MDMSLQFNNIRIFVDSHGFANGTVYEGALGFVLMVQSPAGLHALKLPRLMADTDRENHYIASVMEQEATNAAKIRPSDPDSQEAAQIPGIPGALATLINAHALKHIDHGEGGTELAVIVNFGKDTPPRFCLVTYRPDQQTITFEPAGVGLAEWLTPSLWREARDLFRGGALTGAGACVTIRPGKASILATATSVSGPDGWFLGVPSPVYEWKTATLEQAVRLGGRQCWQWTDHLNFCSRIAGGLETLYAAGYVHGDLRPANIMYIGSPANWQNYALIDYSSFSALRQAVQNPVAAHEHATVVGAPIAEARQSAFYPVERRAGREREDGDTVIIRRRNGHWLIHVGFRSHMLEKGKSGKEVEAGFSDVEAKLKRTGATAPEPQNGQSQWLAGDRLRVRDFVFSVDAWTENGSGTTYGGSSAWLVYNNRVLVPLTADEFGAYGNSSTTSQSGSSKESKDDRVLSVSRTSPLWQWSMATDMYALGVLLLYSWFYDPVGYNPDEPPRDG